VAKLLEIFSAQKRLWQQHREIEQLRSELAKLRVQNDSMREGMRRCVTCDYRIDFKQRQDADSVARETPAPLQTDYKP
jgi:uncharacterized protein with PIN domain